MPKPIVPSALTRPGVPLRTRFLRAASCAGLLALAACGGETDPDAPFAMEVNGKSLRVPMKPGAVFVDSYQSDWGVSRSFGIRFPAGRGMASLEPGVEIGFEPDRIVAGETFRFDETFGAPIRVTYRPATGHRMSDAQILTYAVEGGGGGAVRFDVFDPSPGGRIAGELVEAVLYGRYEDVHDGRFLEPEEPLELHLRSFPFDCVVPSYR